MKSLTFSSIFFFILAFCIFHSSVERAQAWPSSDKSNSTMSGTGDNYSHATGDYRGGGGGDNDTDSGGSTGCGDRCKPQEYECAVTPEKSALSIGDLNNPLTFTIKPSTQRRYYGGVNGYLRGPSGFEPVLIANNTKTIVVQPANLLTLRSGANLIRVQYRIDRRVSLGETCRSGGKDGNAHVCTENFTIVTDTYKCNTALTVERADVPECSDETDNDDGEDTLADERDPGCHTDGDPTNPETYDPNDDDEENPKPDFTATLSGLPAEGRVGRRYEVTGTVQNSVAIGTSPLSRHTFTYSRNNGNSIEISSFYARIGPSPLPTSQRTATRAFVPTEAGTYEVCLIADSSIPDLIDESDEDNNRDCKTIEVTGTTVTNDVSVSVYARKVGDTAWIPDTLTITEGDDAQVRVVPRNATSCDPTTFGFNGTVPDTIPRNDLPQGTHPHTVTCDGVNGPKSSTVNIIVNPAGTDLATPTLTARTPVRRETTSTLTWNLGGRESCTLTGGELEVIASESGDNTTETKPILGETTFTLTCADTAITAIVKVLPTINEF